MQRVFALILVGIFMAAAWPLPHAMAQQEEAAQPKTTEEFVRLWDRLQQPSDPEERISLADHALKLERELRSWPFASDRDETRARLWWLLGLGYEEWPRGERGDNLQNAIEAFQRALQVFTPERSPRDWGALQNDLANVYLRGVRGDRAHNLEKAIVAYQAALTVFARERLPREWAAAQNNLALAYADRVHGERADNLEKAIAGYEAALTIRTLEALPREWAAAQNNLGIAYANRIRGERADNLEKAIAAFEASFMVTTREALPHEWAGAQNNLALAYTNRVRGDRADNLEKAIAAFEAALQVMTRVAQPREWAEGQNNLGNAYLSRARGDRADNLEKAIAAHQSALTVRTRDALPRLWADTQNNIANAYLYRVRGDRADNLEKAIAAYEAALSVRTREALPREWAHAQHNLAVANTQRIRGTRLDNLEKGIAAFQAALTIFTPESLPREHLTTARHLGASHLETGDWGKASLAYASARESFALLFGQGLNDAEARDLVAEAGPLFSEAAFAAAQSGDGALALALASEGRARLMAVALKVQALDLPVDKRRGLDQLRASIRTEQRAVEATEGIERAAAVEKLVKLRQELLGLVKNANTATSRPGSALLQARALVASGGAVIVPVVTKFGAKLLIVTGLKQSVTLVDLPQLTMDKLDLLVRGDGKTSGWLGAYNIHYLQGGELDRRWPEWLAAVGELGPKIWHLLGARLHLSLRESGIKAGARLVWLPSGALGILPLALAQDPISKRRLADDYEIVYAPSLEALAFAQNQIAKTSAATLAAIINPTGDLLGAEKEGKLVASHFPSKSRIVLQRSAATPDAVLSALKGKTHWHFASHGTFSWADARRSALLMHGHDPLSVGQLLETDGLGRPRLVVLSACETGLYDITNSPDEFIGLPGTFTALGAAGVLGTLWPVSDAATALLIARFYELHMGEGRSPPTALSRAQAWLRHATDRDLQAYVRVASKQGRLESRHVAEFKQDLSTEGQARSRSKAAVEWIASNAMRTTGKKRPQPARRDARPYAHPYFWAGFIHTGL